MVNILDNNGDFLLDPNKEGEILSYHIDKKMLRYLDKIKKKITQKDKDYVLIVDGYEGSGKSTLAQQIGKYVDPTLDLARICMTADEFKQQIIEATKGQCVIYDEAVTGMSSSDSISRIGKLLKSMMMQMRQKNLFVIVIIPTIFEMGKYVVLSRARSLLRTYESGDKMGYWVGYNKKDLKNLYIRGKKTYATKVKSNFRGRFYGKYAVNEMEYRKKKEEALFLIEEKPRKDDLKEVYIKICGMNKYEHNLGSIKQAQMYKKYGIKMAKSVIIDNIKEFTEKYGNPTSTDYRYIL